MLYKTNEESGWDGMIWQEDDQKITVISYDKNTGYFDCVDENGRKHMIDLTVGASFPENDVSWFIGKSFLGRFVPYHSFACDMKLLEQNGNE